MAQQERAFIREQIAAGKDKAQIKAALVDEYGEEILAEPERATASTPTLWIVPIVLVLLAAVGIGVAVSTLARNAARRQSRRSCPPPLSAEDARRLDAELGR